MDFADIFDFRREPWQERDRSSETPRQKATRDAADNLMRAVRRAGDALRALP